MACDTLDIVEFNPCQKCGECCRYPCDLIPSDLKPLLESFGLDLSSFFRRYLIALPIALSKNCVDEILMMVPVRVYDDGERSPKYLADSEYLNKPGRCIFLKGTLCSIHDIIPFGGRFLKCAKMTGTVDLQLRKSQYFPFWRKNQHLFESIFPEFASIFGRLESIHDAWNKCNDEQRRKQLDTERVRVFSEELFPLFNGTGPVGGYDALFEQ